MSIASLATDLEAAYEGEVGAINTGKLYTVQYPTNDKAFVRKVEMSWDTKTPTGKEEIVPRKIYSWKI